MNSWMIVKVPKGTLIDVCTERQIESSRQSFGKNEHTHSEQWICEEHVDFSYNCGNCHDVEVVVTSDDKKRFALEMAETGCNRHEDTWVVDGDTGQVVAAFRMNIERLV